MKNQMPEVPFIQLLPPDANLRSAHVCHLWNRVGDSLRNLSQAQKESLISSGHRFTFALISGSPFTIQVTENGDVRISAEALGLLWTCSNLNLSYWKVRTEASELGTTVDIDPTDHPILMAALNLLSWALNEQPSEWPEGLPHPLANPERESDEMQADEVTLRALGFILLHEISHRILGHSPIASDASECLLNISHQQEADADREAMDIYFGNLSDQNSGEFIVRGYGVVTAIFYLSLPSIFTGRWYFGTHPPGWLRMSNILSHLALPEFHTILTFASELKTLYIGISGGITGGRFESPAQSLDQFYEDCSKSD